MLIRTVRSWDVLGNLSFSKNWAEAAWGSSRAREVARGRIVALKRRFRGPESTPQDLERFRIEAMAAARLAHPHFVPVFQVGECDGQPYFTMQYVEGTTLARTLADGLLPAQDAARLLVPVCRAIRYAHDYGVLHRDLKPPNVMLRDNDDVALIDFGLARALDGSTPNTRTGILRGSPYYMSPEQALGEPLDVRSDFYSLGIMYYEMLTRRKPYTGSSAMEVLQQHVNAPLPQLPNPIVHHQALLDRLLAKSRDERFSSAAEILAVIAVEREGQHAQSSAA
jgi:serine/threonine protein kinase